MGDRTGISWTNATWNVVTGCSHVSPGCHSCYAEALSLRYGWSKKPWTAPNAAENVVLHPERLDQPLRWRKPRRVFVNSMSDLFHEQVPDEFLDRVFAVMLLGSWHIFQVLTKRAERLRAYCGSPATIGRVTSLVAELMKGRGSVWITHGADGLDGIRLPNVWLGVSVEDQRRADERIPILLETPAAVRWVSAEPLLGPIDFEYPTSVWPDGPPMCCSGFSGGVMSCGCHGLPVEPPLWMDNSGARVSWMVVGGESGPNHRPMDMTWLEDIVAQCRAADIPVFVKQDSDARPGQQGRIPDDLWALKEFPA